MDVVFVTKNGMVKRTSVEEFRAQGRGGGGVTAMGVGAGDAIVDAVVLGAAKGVMVVTASGTAIHFAAEELRAMGRGAQGVRAIRLKENDTVVAVVAA